MGLNTIERNFMGFAQLEKPLYMDVCNVFFSLKDSRIVFIEGWQHPHCEVIM